MDLGLDGGSSGAESYRVLARKYRPKDFKTLYGQEALVRTLTNAITSGRLAHAFMLTGVRGVGKTTTARIMARALNCSAAGVDGPTAEPCGACSDCKSILEGTHADVLEMDAASNTGVEYIRELQESVAYRPVQGRYKIYVIDEVHMLSTSAFNALLKTLEEPPEQVIFIFATTEIRKVPVTVLSRCQRFDLRRIEGDVLIQLFTHIVGEEGLEAEAEALALIARAADGSARDGLSILDQAIALSGSPVTAQAVQDMLGLADRARVLDLFAALMGGDVPAMLSLFDELYSAGAEPLQLMTDLAEVTHALTRQKVSPGGEPATILGETGAAMAQRLSVAHLSRAWQMLSKAVGEVKGAESPKEAADMALIRLTYAANLPTPDDIIKKLEGAPLKRTVTADAATHTSTDISTATDTATATATAPMVRAAPSNLGANLKTNLGSNIASNFAAERVSAHVPHAAPSPSPTPAPPPAANERGDPSIQPIPGSSGADPNVKAIHAIETVRPKRIETLEDITEALLAEREFNLSADLRAYGSLITLSPGDLVLAAHPKLERAILNPLSTFLMKWTGQTWLVHFGEGEGNTTIAQSQFDTKQAAEKAAKTHPIVLEALKTFPSASITKVELGA